MASKKSLLKRIGKPCELFWFTDTRVVRYIGEIESINETSKGIGVKLKCVDTLIHIEDIHLNPKEACNLWIYMLKKQKKQGGNNATRIY